jgi:hypothetical protein
MQAKIHLPMLIAKVSFFLKKKHSAIFFSFFVENFRKVRPIYLYDTQNVFTIYLINNKKTLLFLKTHAHKEWAGPNK